MTNDQVTPSQDVNWLKLVRDLLSHAVREQAYTKTDYTKYTISKAVSGYVLPLKVSTGLPLRRKGRGIDKESSVLLGKKSSPFEREDSAFYQLLPDLLKTTKDKFVAIRDQRVIDEDDDEFELARRMELAYRGKFVLIRQVLPSQPAFDLLESPEWETA
jgi:hypothetical protein